MSGFRVIVAGGGVAGVEGLLALAEMAGDAVDLTLLAPGEEFAIRALSVREPFAAHGAERHALADIARRSRADLVPARLEWVDTAASEVHTDTAGTLAYDALLLATGARPAPFYEHATVFRDDRAGEIFGGIVQDLEGGYADSIAFLMPPGPTWRLPLYELALMTAERAADLGVDARLSLVTPEPAPLAELGDELAARTEEELDRAGVDVYTQATAQLPSSGHVLVAPHGIELEVKRTIALPQLTGPRLRGIPHADAHGFVAVDTGCRVPGTANVFAAGDGTAFPVKNGGLSAQQADVAAAGITRLAGIDIEAPAFRPVVRGTLFTGGAPLYFQTAIVGGHAFDSKVSDRPLWPVAEKVMAVEINRYLTQ